MGILCPGGEQGRSLLDTVRAYHVDIGHTFPRTIMSSRDSAPTGRILAQGLACLRWAVRTLAV
jgi:hypothetical protein